MSRLLPLLLLVFSALGAGEPPAEMKRVRELAVHDKHRDEAAVMCRRISEDGKRDADERARAARLLPILLAAAGKADEAKAEAARLAAARPGERHAAGIAPLVDALLLGRDGKRDEAVAALRKLTADADTALQARARYHLAALLARDAKGKHAPTEAQAEAAALAEGAVAGADDPWDARAALQLARETAERARDPALHERVLRLALTGPAMTVTEPRERDDILGRLGRVLQEGKRFDEAHALYAAEAGRAEQALAALRAEGEAVEQRAYEERQRQATGAMLRWRLDDCAAWKNQGDKPRALAAAEAVFAVPFADPGYEWQAAGSIAIECLAEQPERALAAARTMYEAVGGGDAARTLARLLARGDGKEEKAILAWLEHGAAGPDGAAGTADDLPPRQLPARAAHPERAAAARAIVLSSTYLARRRANLLLYAGEPNEAAAVLRWWIGQARSAAEVGALAEVLSRCAVARSGDPAAKRRALRWIADGPAGPDGQAGTADDLIDPLAGITALAPPAPQGEDAALLARLRGAAARICGDDRAAGGLRGSALATVLRLDLLGSTRPTSDELLAWYEGNPAGIMDLLAADRFARDGHLANLGEVQRQLDALGFDKQPDWIKGRRKSWPEVQAELHAGKPSKAWW